MFNDPSTTSGDELIRTLRYKLRDSVSGPISATCGAVAGVLALATGLVSVWIALPAGIVAGWVVADRILARKGW